MISNILLLLSLLLACLFGSSNQAWSWGPALLALAGALVASAFERPAGDVVGRVRPSLWAAVILCSLYLACRALLSPVWEFALADLLLMGAVVGAFLITARMGSSDRWLRLFWTGLSVIVLLNFAVALIQQGDPDFSLLGYPRLTRLPTGLFTQYSYFANFMIGSGCLLAAVGLLRRGHPKLRALWGLAAAAAFASVWLSRSRGSLIGFAVAGAVLLVLMLPALKRRSKKGFAALVVALPLLAIAGGLSVGKLLMAAQEARGQAATAEKLFNDNTMRLHFLGAALEGTTRHPWFGGGSQAFRWECRQNWDIKAWGMMSADPDFVHNEYMQALTDYGVVGLLLLLVALLLLLVFGLSSVFVAPGTKREDLNRQAILIGALAGMAGMLCQAGFSFVFHTLPPVLLVGAMAGLVSGNSGYVQVVRERVGRGLIPRLLAVALGLALVPIALRGAGASAVILRGRDDPETVMNKASGLWPSAEFQLNLGHYYFSRSRQADSNELRREAGEEAEAAYAAALGRNPLEPEASVNRARILSMLGRNEECEAEFRRAIQLQGAFEAGYKAHYYCADHYYRLGISLLQQQKMREAKASIGKAREHLVESGKLCHGGHFAPGVVHRFRLRTKNADDFLTGFLSYQEGYELWQQRKPEQALVRFREAAKVLEQIRLPRGFRPAPDSQEGEILTKTRQAIKFLEGAGIRPAGGPEEE